jgi:type I restriction enzyme S subunit
VLRLLQPVAADTKFIFYWLLARRPVLIALSSGGGQPNLNQAELRSIRAELPPVEEQRAIAAFLDRETARLDGLVAQKEKLLALLEEKRASLITHAVTRGLNPHAPTKPSGIPWLGHIPQHWEVKRLQFVAPLLGGYARSRTDSFGDEGTPDVRMNSLPYSAARA